MPYNTLESQLEDISGKVYEKLDELIPEGMGLIEQKLMESMRYSTLSGGKRLRPFLTVASSQLFGVSQETALQTAAVIELIHSYSIVHDDLPALDNDDFRRGQPSTHRKFGEAIAILTGDALLTYAFEILADYSTHPDASVRCELIRSLANSAGFAGMVGGQAMDMLTENQQLEFDEIVRMQRMKTGALFAISCEAGAILGKAAKPSRMALKAYANNLGLAFQIINDLMDAEGTREESGKAIKKDAERGKATLISFMGNKEARQHAKMLSNQASEYLSAFGPKAHLMQQLAEYVIERNK